MDAPGAPPGTFAAPGSRRSGRGRRDRDVGASDRAAVALPILAPGIEHEAGPCRAVLQADKLRAGDQVVAGVERPDVADRQVPPLRPDIAKSVT